MGSRGTAPGGVWGSAPRLKKGSIYMLTTNFLLSQFFMIVFYIFYATTYRVKKRNAILILNSIGQVAVFLRSFFFRRILGRL